MPKLHPRLVPSVAQILQQKKSCSLTVIIFFEKTNGLTVSLSTSFGFLSQAEAKVAMRTAKQYDLINVHIEPMWPSNLSHRIRGKIDHGCDKKIGCGNRQLGTSNRHNR